MNNNSGTATVPPLGGPRAWTIWALGATAFGYAFFQRVTPSVMVDDLMRDFSVGAAVLGNLSALYFYAYAGLQLPIGSLIDRWGARRMIAVSLILAATGSVLFGLAPSIYPAYAGRLLIGIGSAVGFVGTLTLISHWFPQNRFALLSGLTMFVAMLAGIGGQAPLAAVVEATGWRTTMIGAGVFGFVLAGLIWITVRATPEVAAGIAVRKVGTAKHSVLRDLRSTFSNIHVWTISITALTMTGPMLAFGGLWAVPYLMARYGIDRPEAAFVASLMFVGWAIGAPLNGWLSDFIGRRKTSVVVGSLVSTSMISILFFWPGLPLEGAATAIFLTGLFGATMVISFALSREIIDPAYHGTVTGIVNGFTVGSGALLQPVIGLLLDLQWDGQLIDGARQYSLDAYHFAFASLIICGVIGFLCALTLPETYCRPLDKYRQQPV